VPPPAGRVVTSPYRQPVAGVVAHHVIHAPQNPARALPPPPFQLDSHLSRLLSPTFALPAPSPLSTAPAPPSPTAKQRAPEFRSLLPERRVPPSHPVPKFRRSGCVGLGGAVAAATILHSFLPPWTRRTLQVCVQRGPRDAHGLRGAPSSHPAARLLCQLRLPWGPRADLLLEPLTLFAPCTPGLQLCFFFFFFLLSLLLLVLFPYRPPPPPRFPSKSGGWRREKSSLESKGAVRTDLSATEEDPRSGRALQPVGALERRARAERRLRSTRCPLGRSAPPPPSAPRSPPQHRGPGNPPARFFVQFQQSSEEVGPFVPLFIDCVNIAKRRRRSGGPSPAPRPAPRREKPQHTT
jgi:hypothetical protein